MKETSQRWRGALYAVSEKDWSRVSINRGTKRTPYDKEAGSEILGTKCDRPGLLLSRAPGLRPTLWVSLIDLSGASDQPPRDLRLLTLGIPVTARGWRAHCELTATGSGPLRKGRDRKNGQPRRCLMWKADAATIGICALGPCHLGAYRAGAPGSCGVMSS